MKCDTCGKEIIKDGRREPDFSSYICKECNEKKKQEYVEMPTIKCCHQCGLKEVKGTFFRQYNTKVFDKDGNLMYDEQGRFACEEHKKRGDA